MVHTCCRILEAGFEDAQLHLRLVAWHEDNVLSGKTTSLKIETVRTLLMPRQHVLRKLDPDGDRHINDVCAALFDLADKYASIVIDKYRAC